MTLAPELAGDINREWLSDGSGEWELTDGNLALEAAGAPSARIRRPGARPCLANVRFATS